MALPSAATTCKVAPGHRCSGSGEDRGAFCALIRSLSRPPTPVLVRLPLPVLDDRLRPVSLAAGLGTPVRTGAHLYSAPQHVASADTLLGRVPATCGSEEPEAMQDPGCGLTGTPLPRTPVDTITVVPRRRSAYPPGGMLCSCPGSLPTVPSDTPLGVTLAKLSQGAN